MPISTETIERTSFSLSLILFALAFLLINHYSFQLDLTKNQRNTLSPATREILGELKDTLIINYYVSDAVKNVSLFPQEINNFLEIYKSASANLVYRQFTDDSLPVPLSEIGLEAHKTTIQKNGRSERVNYYSGIELIYAGKRALISYVNRTEDLEYTLTTAIDRIVHPFQGEVGIVFGEPIDTLEEGYRNLNAMLFGYNLKEMAINADLDPNKTPAVILIGSSLLRADQVDILENYLREGGALLVCAGGTNLDVLQTGGTVISLADSPLMRWLASLGVLINADLVLDPLSATTINASDQLAPYPAILTLVGHKLYSRSPLIKGLSRLVLAWTSSVSLETLTYVKTKILATTSPAALSMAKGINAEPIYVLKWLEDFMKREGKEQGSTFPLAVSLQIDHNERPWEDSESFSHRRMVVIGSRYAFHDALLPFGGQNLDLLVRCVDWLLKRDSLTGLKKERVVTTWYLNNEERVKIHEYLLLINALLLPVILIAVGIVTQMRRRGKSHQKRE